MIVDLSGFMFSGKSAVSDILSEFENVYVPDKRVEFDLLRVGGGLIDLKNAVDDWSPVRSYSALRRFISITEKLQRGVSFNESFLNVGWRYNERFPDFKKNLDAFFEDLIEIEWRAEWPYNELELDSLDLALIRLNFFSKSRRVTVRSVSQLLGLIFQKLIFRNYKPILQNNPERYILVSKDRFINAAQNLIYNLLWQGVDKNMFESVVVHNALEPFDPGKNIDLLGKNAKCIVVDRDPRDIYATSISFQHGFNDNVKFYKSIAGADDVYTFIKRYKTYRANVKEDSRILRLNFSDLILNYEDVLKRLYDYLDINDKKHINKGLFFSPVKSINNLNMWQNEKFKSKNSDFNKIADECI